MQCPPLSPEVIAHFGLNEAPFSTAQLPRGRASSAIIEPATVRDFYLAGPSQRNADAAIANWLDRDGAMLAIGGPRGSGVTTWMRQWAAKSGIDRRPLQVVATSARRVTLDVVASRLEPLAQHNWSRGIQTLWFLDNADRQTWMTLRSIVGAGSLLGLRTVVFHRGEMRSDIDWQSPTRGGLADCLTAAMRHAGRRRAVLLTGAVERIAMVAGDRYDSLASITHQCLIRGAGWGLKEIDESSACELLAEPIELPESQTREFA